MFMHRARYTVSPDIAHSELGRRRQAEAESSRTRMRYKWPRHPCGLCWQGIASTKSTRKGIVSTAISETTDLPTLPG